MFERPHCKSRGCQGDRPSFIQSLTCLTPDRCNLIFPKKNDEDMAMVGASKKILGNVKKAKQTLWFLARTRTCDSQKEKQRSEKKQQHTFLANQCLQSADHASQPRPAQAQCPMNSIQFASVLAMFKLCSTFSLPGCLKLTSAPNCGGGDCGLLSARIGLIRFMGTRSLREILNIKTENCGKTH